MKMGWYYKMGLHCKYQLPVGNIHIAWFVQTYFSGKWVGIELYCETEMACSETEVKQIQIKQLWRLFIYNSNIKLKLAEL